MSRRNVVRVSFEVVDGGGLRDLERASNALNNLGRAGTNAAPGVGGAAQRANEAARASENLAGSAERATNGLTTMQQAGVATAAAISAVAIGFGIAAKAAIDFGIDAVAAAERASKAQLSLQSVAKLTGQDFASLNVLVDQLVQRVPELSRASAAEVVAKATRFTSQAGRPEDTSRFIDAIIGAMRANGASLEDLSETLKQIAGGGLETALDKILGGTNPSEVYKRRFAEVGGSSAETLTDAQQKQAVLNEIFAQAGKLGDITAPDTVGRNVSILKARFEDLEAAIGKVIERNEGLRKTVDMLTNLTTKLGDPSVAANVQVVGRGLATVAQGLILLGGGIAFVLNIAKLATDAFSGILGIVGVGFTSLATIVSGGIAIMIGKTIEILSAALGPAAAKIVFGGVDGGALAGRGQAEASGALESFNAFMDSQKRALLGDIQNFKAIIDTTSSIADLAGRFGRFAAEGAPAGTNTVLAATAGQSVPPPRDPFAPTDETIKANTAAAEEQTKAAKDLAKILADQELPSGSITVIAGANTTVDYVPTGGNVP